MRFHFGDNFVKHRNFSYVNNFAVDPAEMNCYVPSNLL